MDIWINKYWDSDELIEDQKLLKHDNIELYKIYQEAILNRDPSVLKEKTQQQVQELKKLFQSKQLKKFNKFVEDFIVIRHDSNWTDTFKAPIHTWNQSWGWNYYTDHMVRAENYVYASFDKISHYMTKYDWKTNSLEQNHKDNIYWIQEWSITNRAELVFCDIANIPWAKKYWNWKNRWVLETYMLNCFEYNTGKELLALYLSIVFDSEEDVIEFFSNNHPHQSQHWYDSFWGEKYKSPIEQWQKDINSKIDFENNTIERMKEIFVKTWIIPPLSLEVRIQDEAEKKEINQIIENRKKTVLNKVLDILLSKK